MFIHDSRLYRWRAKTLYFLLRAIPKGQFRILHKPTVWSVWMSLVYEVFSKQSSKYATTEILTWKYDSTGHLDILKLHSVRHNLPPLYRGTRGW